MAKNVIINGVTYSDVPKVEIPISDSGGGTAEFFDTSDATLSDAGEMLTGVTAYSKGRKISGTIQVRSSSDLTVSGAKVKVPVGFYYAEASKSVATGSAKTPATTITVTPSVSIDTSTGVVTASVSKTQNITPTVTAGYVSSGTAGAITVDGSDTLELTTQAARTITPSTSNQTVAAGTYLTGALTVAGDADLVASNIKSGVNIFGVAGSLTLVSVSQDSTTKVLSIS